MENVYMILGSLLGGFFLVLTIRFLGDLPFPWELRRRNPNRKALAKCFQKLHDGSSLDIVMGEMNESVCSESVGALKEALKRSVKIRIINSPMVDARSRSFLELLDNSKIELYINSPRPESHFRIVNGKELYIEEPHLPFKDEGYRYTKSRRLLSKHTRIFSDLLCQSKKVSINEFKLVEPQ